MGRGGNEFDVAVSKGGGESDMTVSKTGPSAEVAEEASLEEIENRDLESRSSEDED